MAGFRRTADERRARRWTSRPARPVRYGMAIRIFDALSGWRDGRRGLPELSEEADTPASTQRLTEVREFALGGIANERLSAIAQEERIRAARSTARSRLDRAAELAEERWTSYQDAREPLSDSELARRGLGELDLPETEIWRRRAADRERRLRAAEATYTETRRAARSARQDVELLDEVLVTHKAVGLIREWRLREHALRRSALYWRHLIRVHPDGMRLNSRLPPVRPALPDWSREPAPPEHDRSERTI